MDRSPYRKSIRSFDKIRRILNRWDPLAVSDLDSHQYDIYVFGVMSLLDRSDDVTHVANALQSLAKQMGGDSRYEHDRKIAEELIQQWQVASLTKDEGN